MLEFPNIMSGRSAPPEHPVPGLGEVLARTGEDLLPVHHAESLPVQSVVLSEPGNSQQIPPYALVLAVGYKPGDPLFEDLMSRAARAGAAAVIAKPSAASQDAFRLLGQRHGISAILASPDVDWLTLAALLKSACAVALDNPVRRHAGDLFAFANAVALAAGGAASVVDPAGQILGFSNLPDQPLDELRRRTTLHMEEVEAPAEDPDYQRVYAADGCVRIAGHDGAFDRVAAAVRSEGEILGSIWVLVPDPGRGQHAEEALAALLDAAAVHLHHARLGMNMQQTRHALLLESLLRGDARAAASAGALELDQYEWFRLALLITNATPGPPARRQVQGVTNWLRIAHRRAVAAEIDSRLVILFSGTSKDPWSPIAGSLEHFFSTSQITRASMTIATSFPAGEPRALRAEFERLLILSRLSRPDRAVPGDRSPLIRMEDHWPAVELAIIAENYAGHDADRLAILRKIQEFDRAHNAQYWPTLRGYALANRNYADAAARLHLHPNTVRYRIDRLGELFGLDIDNAGTFAWVVIQSHRPMPA